MAPMGFRFKPDDEQKLAYLLFKVIGNPLPGSNLIGTADLYGFQEPWEIFGDSEEDEQYFFTTLKKVGTKKKNNDEYKRFTRNVGKGGTWSNKGQKIPILGKRRGLIGHKKCFRYVAKNNEDDHINGIWLLKEYTLPDNIAAKNVKVKDEYKDCVLCVLKRKMKKKNTRVTDHDQSPRVESGLVDNNEVLSGLATNNLEMTRVDQSPRVESRLVNDYEVLSGSATNNPEITRVDQSPRVESGLINNYEVLSGSAMNNPEITRVDQSPRVESGLVNDNEVLSGSATNNPEVTRADQSPRVESGLVNNYEVLSGSATNNPEITRVDQSPRVESGWVNNYEVFSGLATNNNFGPENPVLPVQEIGSYYHHSCYGRGMYIYMPGLENPVLLSQENMSNYDDHHVNGDTPEMRAIAKSFLEEEKSYLQTKRSNYENNNIDFLGGCLPISFVDYLAAADCTPMELLY
ncbi:hypothetical protein CASFOL_032973 [Castilleja foliolosa]|uniref:NAC domain-containing protein n=1 Tax=Castilleja foliolosa TaxID=1961234 RepID=A0ABD3C3M1_9LAMI